MNERVGMMFLFLCRKRGYEIWKEGQGNNSETVQVKIVSGFPFLLGHLTLCKYNLCLYEAMN